MSLDASVRATIEYFVGTLGGAIYAVAIAFLAPHNGEISLVFTLALAVAPLAFLAAVNSSFRVGPFTAVIIILGATATHIGPIDCSAALLARCAAPSVDAASMALTDYAARSPQRTANNWRTTCHPTISNESSRSASDSSNCTPISSILPKAHMSLRNRTAQKPLKTGRER
jgi:hypothetical protein